MKNVKISLSTVTYKRHINVVLCTRMMGHLMMYEMFLLGKDISIKRKILILQLRFHWTYPMPHLHKHLILHTLYIYKLNMKNVSITLRTITYKNHINIVYVQWLAAVPESVKSFYLV
jgi:hypothetical protein